MYKTHDFLHSCARFLYLELPKGVSLDPVGLIHSDCGGGDGSGLVDKEEVRVKLYKSNKTNLLEWREQTTAELRDS